ncbi:Endonuclease/exonuclease/phosphatase [Mycena albidolilacea]|uniref:Endonuclease/exonuclease/phosphatase n=1 Tax=Mycena albidolilacea TaxID=1033008 RepID=A0AAD7AKY3_9AGAR|nr:Endonuclease/exonuclease/phosphatase [Mycena albidolilacea]
MSKRFQLTPEQIALSEERKAKKQKLQAQAQVLPSDKTEERLLARPWLNLNNTTPANGIRVKLMTWNLLAQCLVRRELFPTSGNVLKGAQRQPMLHAEILRHGADIMCLQEVDSLDKILPALEAAQYNHHFVAGPGKKHGCLVAFKRTYEKIDERLIHYDELHVRSEGDENTRRGSSFRTRNIGSIVALKDLSNDGEGVVIGTTHLFWHPKYTYERTRQAGILVREMVKFRSDLQLENWPCMIAGDFNFSPDDPGYSLLVGDQLNAEQRDRLETSRVVHLSIDPTVPPTVKGAPAEDEGGAVDPDRVITSARRAVPADGLLSDSELASLFSAANVVRSAYDEGLRQYKEASSTGFPTFGDRMSLPRTKKGYYEPEYTSYTHYWKVCSAFLPQRHLLTSLSKTVLDYIFILTDRPAVVDGLLSLPLVKDLVPGLPQKGICGSDHLSLCAEIILPPISPIAESEARTTESTDK